MLLLFKQLAFVFFCIAVPSVHGGHNLHTSMVQLKQLWEGQVQAVAMLEKVQSSIKKIQSNIEEYLNDFQSLNLHLQSNADFLDNPIDAFLFIRHVGLGWKNIEEALSSQRSIQSEIDHLLGRNEIIPDETDVDGASLALGRLHGTYRFNLSALISENILSATIQRKNDKYATLGSLSVWDLTKIGLDSFNNNMLDVCVDFLSAALQKSKQINSKWKYFENEIDVSRIKNFYQTAIRIHDQTLEKKGFKSEKHSTHRRPVSAKMAKMKKYQNLAEIEPVIYQYNKKVKQKLQKTHSMSSDTMEEYQAIRLCRGEDLRNVKQTAELFCRYVHNDSPWLRIGPLKGEIQSLQPYLIVIHDLLSEDQCNEAINFMGTAIVTPPLANKSTKKWTLKHNWLEERDHRVFDYLTKKIEAIAGVLALSTIHAEKFMVSNYGLGGSYQVHSDYFGSDSDSNKAQTGDRIATFMTYLEAPKSGGFTVWPWLGISIQPVKGSAVLWWNLYPSEAGDKFTRHMACPVLFGSKWVANKWIGYISQWNKTKCTLDKNQRFQIPFR